MGKDENIVDRAVPSTPAGERVVPSLARPKPAAAPATKRDVMDTLLGRNDLVALDESGRDPYNATGRHFRR